MTPNTTYAVALMQQIPALQGLAANADHIDVKSISTDLPMRRFIANMFSYMPRWMQFLYGVRWLFVRLLGMKQPGIPQQTRMAAEDVPFHKGAWTTFFQVADAVEDQHWFAAASDTHLTAHLGLIKEPAEQPGHEGLAQYHVVTLVYYHHWTGPLYFNVIRPFHHFVVNQMMKAAVQGG